MRSSRPTTCSRSSPALASRTDGWAGAACLSAATRWATVPGSAAVVIASIASTSFDGAQEEAFKSAIEDLQLGLRSRIRPDHHTAAQRTLFMALPFAGVAGVFSSASGAWASFPVRP